MQLNEFLCSGTLQTGELSLMQLSHLCFSLLKSRRRSLKRSPAVTDQFKIE